MAFSEIDLKLIQNTVGKMCERRSHFFFGGVGFWVAGLKFFILLGVLRTISNLRHDPEWRERHEKKRL